MIDEKMQKFVENVLANMPSDWLKLTTHRLDIYNEKMAKVEFLEYFQNLFESNSSSTEVLNEIPTAYDYIRLGHPLSCILEWWVAKQHGLNSDQVISFSSRAMPLLAILRKNFLDNEATQILYEDSLPSYFNSQLLQEIYGYKFELKKREEGEKTFSGTTIFLSEAGLGKLDYDSHIDFVITSDSNLGSLVLILNAKQNDYISAIQHVRRRESIAMTPTDSLEALQLLTQKTAIKRDALLAKKAKTNVIESIQEITQSPTPAIVASSGLSIQYAISMGLIHDALEKHAGKDIKFIVPTNCYGGTNDQARRIAACIGNVDLVDLSVDGDNDMVRSIDVVLDQIALEDAVPYIIAEIPTNPRVEVPDLIELERVLNKNRKTKDGKDAIKPVFILDQTFCPNFHFLGEDEILSGVQTISYVSGSKFPSGGLCTAGYCVANRPAAPLMEKIELHLSISDNQATDFQLEILAKQLPSMNQRIVDAYKNTRAFVDYIGQTLPDAKINFVSNELAEQGFMPSVFSLDLPTKGNSDEERESYKRELNHKLIDLMISKIPTESKHCVSYGQLQGCYWTIPATSTQGTTKEGDKDYIARVALSADLDVELHKSVFLEFVNSI